MQEQLLNSKASHLIPLLSNESDEQCLPLHVWQHIPAIAINCVHPRSSEHHPKTIVKIARDQHALHMRFEVEDRYVCCRHMQRQSSVCQDSCVEAFLKPLPDKGYFNFEINIAGVIHASYIADHTRVPAGFKDRTMLLDAELDMIQIRSDSHARIDPEITEPMCWSITCRIPISLFEQFVGSLNIDSTTRWQGNFYKCADHSSHPHWLSWQPVGHVLNFHQPECFGKLCFNMTQ